VIGGDVVDVIIVVKGETVRPRATIINESFVWAAWFSDVNRLAHSEACKGEAGPLRKNVPS